MNLQPNNHAPVSVPDEPSHRETCSVCGGKLRKDGWEFELIPEEHAVVWFAHCDECGMTVLHD